MDTSEYVRSGERTLAGISFEIMNSEAFDSLDLNSSKEGANKFLI